MVPCSRAMSLTFRFISSTGRKPVSLLIRSLVARVLPEFAMSWSSFGCDGIFMVLVSEVYLGGFHVRLLCLQYCI